MLLIVVISISFACKCRTNIADYGNKLIVKYIQICLCRADHYIYEVWFEKWNLLFGTDFQRIWCSTSILCWSVVVNALLFSKKSLWNLYGGLGTVIICALMANLWFVLCSVCIRTLTVSVCPSLSLSTFKVWVSGCSATAYRTMSIYETSTVAVVGKGLSWFSASS